MADLPTIAEVEAGDAATLDRLLREATAPFVVRGLVTDWPLVEAARQSSQAARDYLVQHHRDIPFTVSIGRPGPTSVCHQPGLPVTGFEFATCWSPVRAWQTRIAFERSAFSVP